MVFGRKKKQEVEQEIPVPNPMREMVREQERNQEQAYQEQMPKVPQRTEDNEDAVRWKVGEIATQTERVLHDSATGKSYDIYSAIALILNKAYEE